MLICRKCNGKVAYLPTDKEYHYECDRPCYEEIEVNVCPHCGAKDCVEPATECKICGDHFYLDGKTEYCFCDTCIDKYKTVENALKVGTEFTADVSGINEFVAFALTPEEINKVLVEYVKKNYTNIDKVRKYCDADPEWFAEWVERNFPDDIKN